MNSNKILFGILVIVVFGITFLGIIGSIASPRSIDPSRDSIRMIQPFGWWPARDSQYAQDVNKPNSEANRNNAEANHLNAQATKTVADAQLAEQQRQDAATSPLMAFCGAFSCIGVLAFLGLAMFFERTVGEQG